MALLRSGAIPKNPMLAEIVAARPHIMYRTNEAKIAVTTNRKISLILANPLAGHQIYPC